VSGIFGPGTPITDAAKEILQKLLTSWVWNYLGSNELDYFLFRQV
jgi:hypothetical protein